ncbi:MAG: hypothetical protein M5U13_16150 [Thermoanaerobaculia bacterium]|nr:hypothetical protein [Thermoanaerobaculia bacterium]
MSMAVPWLRSVVAFPLGLVAIHVFHLAGQRLLPLGYGALDSDGARWLALALATVAGIVGSFVVGAVAGHRLRLHLAIFFVLMLVIDLGAIRGGLAAQPVWLKTLVLAVLPLQVWIGGRITLLAFAEKAPVAGS